jgi:hypothetical protein
VKPADTADNKKITDYYQVRRSTRCTETELKVNCCLKLRKVVLMIWPFRTTFSQLADMNFHE